MARFVNLLVELLSVVALVAGLIIVGQNFEALPDTIPIHFGLSGQPDGFGPKVWLPVLSGLSVLLYGCMWLGQLRPQWSNTPWKITDENRARQYALIRSLMTCLKALTTLLFAYLQYEIVNVGFKLSTGLSPAIMALWAVSLLSTIIWYFVSAYRAR